MSQNSIPTDETTVDFETGEVIGEISKALIPVSSTIIKWDSNISLMETARSKRIEIAHQLIKGIDFGEPFKGAGKDVLLHPGAQKITDFFELYGDPVLLSKVENWDRTNPLFHYHYQMKLRQRGTNIVVAIGEGSCNSNEEKYYWREKKRVCPKCGKDAINKSKRGGWFCWAKFGGCGAQFPLDDDPAIIKQEVGRVMNDNIYDQVNTILKMAIKRAHIGAVLNFGFSELFTQDLDVKEEAEEHQFHADESIKDADPHHAPTKEIPFPKKHPGKGWDEIDTGFLQWVAKQDDGKGERAEKAKAELERREKTDVKNAPSDAKSVGFIPKTDAEKKEAEMLLMQISGIVDSGIFPAAQGKAIMDRWNALRTLEEMREAYVKTVAAADARKASVPPPAVSHEPRKPGELFEKAA